MGDPPKFTFGTPASTGTSSTSLFGGTTGAKPLFGQSTGDAPKPTGTGLFGGAPPSSGQSGPSLFGGGSGTAAPSGGLSFGAKTDGAGTSGGGVFGGNATTTGSGFSFGKATEKTNANSGTPGQTSSAAGSTTPFGSIGNNPLGGGGLFGQTSKSAPSNSDQTATPAAQKPSPSMFSTTPAGPPPTGGPSLFGAAKPAAGSTGLFGQKNDKPVSSPFGQTSGTGGNTLFGQKPDQPATSGQSAPSLFGAKAGAGQAGPSLFGKPNDNQASEAPKEAPKPAFSFPSSTPSKPLFGEVGQKSDSSQASKPAFSLGQAPASVSTSTTSSPAPSLFPSLGKPAATTTPSSDPASSNLFSGLSQNKDTAAPAATSAPSQPSLFSLGKKDDAAAAAPATTTANSNSLFKLGQPAAATEAAKPAATSTGAPSLFGQATTATTGANQSTCNDPPTTTAPSAALGASITGPAPPAASRLASKSLDEILTLWTTSLTAHQKTFGNMATRISQWDRQLVDNSEKISKLYARTFQAERDTAEVERQLAAVEGEQQELERYLDQYEKTVDELIARNGGVEGGVDAERERTYRIAERCSSRLTSMSHDLTSMIEEINAASTNLRQSNKSANAQDPLTQIVRVLNGHLSQLQVIDQGASALQQKVTAAQKEARTLSRNGYGNDEVDGFAKSFLGRR